jgi:hypothetical protein
MDPNFLAKLPEGDKAEIIKRMGSPKNEGGRFVVNGKALTEDEYRSLVEKLSKGT